MSTTKWLRFADLRERGIINSWPMVRRRVQFDGFPPGRKFGPNTRVWSEDEVDAWLRSRPTARPRREVADPEHTGPREMPR
jgi:hypothetical protein